MRSRYLALFVLTALCACVGEISEPGKPIGQAPGIGPGLGPGIVGTGPLSNQEVYNRLGTTCGGCHKMGNNRPLFATLATFEVLVVYEPKWVTPGQPDASELLRLLSGQGTGTYKQMPIQGEHFAARAARGDTAITMAQLREWITQLPPKPTGPISAARDATLVRKKDGRAILKNLERQLGLNDEDFFDGVVPDPRTGTWRRADPARYAAKDPADPVGSDRTSIGTFAALGGANYLANKRENADLSATFAQVLVPMSQAWCRRAIEKPGNTAILKFASTSDTSADSAGAARIKKNIAYLYLNMLGESADADELADLVALYDGYRAQDGVIAWTAVCAALIRDPLWVTY